MPGKPHSNDVVFLVPTPSPLPIGQELIEQARSILCSRLTCHGIVAGTPSDEPFDALSSDEDCPQPDRLVIIPCGFAPLELSQIRSAWWFGHLPNANEIFLAAPWTPREFGQWIGNRAIDSGDSLKPLICMPLDRDLQTDSARSEAQIETLALVAFWANRLRPNSVVLESSMKPNTQELVDPPFATLIDPEDLATWMVQRYLRTVRSRPIPWSDQSDEDWPALRHLHEELQQHLPSEYSERLDEVSPRSMGSAKIAPDESGKVPWDKIWTSFCDLAMAGGPPHRGKLLEPVPPEAIEKSPAAYQAVVAEIRRGIGLASGLCTSDSPYPGWICVECHNDQMAAWLMRAILVENISVRRESTKLYLPAGPDYRIDKEIKNVITAVAKTNHYWQAHLRSRQPPNPL